MGIEGLLMYLPPAAAKALFRSTSSLMSSGSTIAGDTLVDMLRFVPTSPVLEKYGTKFTFEMASKEELVCTLSDVSLKDAEVQNVHQQLFGNDNIEKAQADAQ